MVFLRKKLLLTLILTSVITGGCLQQPAQTGTNSQSQEQAAVAKPGEQTFAQILEQHAGQMIKGKVIAQLPASYSPTPDLYHYAFVDEDGQATYVFASDPQTLKIISLDASENVLKTTTFTGYQLKRAIRQDKILYIGYKGELALKWNMDSFDYSEVSRQEMDQTRSEQQKENLPDGETPVLMRDGYVYTKEGVLFDQKSQDYVLEGGEKLKLYDHADFGAGPFLFSVDPRQDGSLKVTMRKVSGKEVQTEESYIFPLQLSEGYDMSLLEYAMTDNGNLLIFAIGVQQEGDAGSVIKVFKIPFGDWMNQSSDLHADVVQQ